MDLNKITLIGNATKDPEQKSLANGITLTKLNLATNHAWKDSKTGEKKDKACFHSVVAWNGLGQVMMDYVKKGDRIFLEGRLDNRSYQDKTGATKYYTNVIANNLIMLSSKKSQPSDAVLTEELTIEDETL